MLRNEDDLIGDINQDIDNLSLWHILLKSYPLFDYDGKDWHLIKEDNRMYRDEMLMVANEVLNES